MKSKIILRDKIYVPIENEERLEKLKEKLDRHYLVHNFNDKACERCDLISGLGARPIADCYECPNYLSKYKLWSQKVNKGQLYVGFPYGNRSKIIKVIPEAEDMEQVDMTPDIDFKTKLKFTGELREYQKPAISFLMKKAERGFMRGTLLAPPRTGKTSMSIALSCMLRKRTLILTNQHDLCKQFYDTFYGSDNQPALTNAGKVKDSVILAGKIEDFERGDVVISTYQKFISDVGKERLAKIASKFSLLILDEVHRAAAKSFLKVVSTLNTKHKLGLTGTFERKDGLDTLVAYVLGKPIYKVSIDTLRPECVFHETGLHSSKDYSLWTYYLRWLERAEDRKKMIVDWAIKDLKAGHSIVIPCYHTSLIHELVRKINWEYGKKIAAAVVGGSSKRDRDKRDEILEKAKSGELRCIVGTRKIVSTGINVALWDRLYWIDPTSNPPNWIQEYSRILTPLEGKHAIIRFFLDDSGQTVGCLRSCLFKSIPGVDTLAKRAIIKPEQWAIANKYLNKRKGQAVVPDGQEKDTRSFLKRRKR